VTTITPSRFHLPPGYVERSDPAYFVDDTAEVWQPDLYEEVAADPRCAGTILDLGCGNGDKLAVLADRFEVVGVDYGENIQRAVRHGVGSWIAFDLSDGWPKPWLLIPPPKTLTIICADLIEHLPDPSALLADMAWAHRAGCPLIVLSTPDRTRRAASEQFGPPANPCHVREWAPDEFAALLADYGMVAEMRWTRSSSGSDARDTIVATVAQA
jgi:SAM-dependent methyltransferase